MISFRKKKSKSKKKDRDEQTISKELVDSVPGTSSSDKKNKNEIDAEKYYQNKTKSEIAFLKRKEESVSPDLIMSLEIAV